jgi:hypothetical protein
LSPCPLYPFPSQFPESALARCLPDENRRPSLPRPEIEADLRLVALPTLSPRARDAGGVRADDRRTARCRP